MEEPASDSPFSVPEWVDAEIHRVLGLSIDLQESAFADLVARSPEHAAQIRARQRLADEGPDAAAPLQLGRYHLVARLGAGGMGTVHLGFDPQLERHVAIKVMAAHLLDRPVLRKRFTLEATAVAAIRHQNVCRVLEAQPDGEQPYIVMDFIEGKSLDKRLQDSALGLAPLLPGMPPAPGGNRPSTPTSHAEVGAVLEFIEKIARALHELHQRSVFHRDVKPSNLMVTPNGEPILLDFGLVQTEHGAGVTRSGDRPGTREYQAPEQLAGTAEADARTDLYSLGLVLYECLTSQRAFREDRAAASLPEPAHRLNRAIPRDVQTVLDKALEHEPRRRYASALEFAEDLRRIREGHAPWARPLGLGGRLLRWSRRNPWAAGFFIVLTLGLGSSMLLGNEVAAKARDNADLAAESQVRAGFLAAALGNWKEAHAAFDLASRHPGVDKVELEIGRLEAFDAQLDHSTVQARLEALASQSELGAWSPKVALLRADLLMFGLHQHEAGRRVLGTIEATPAGAPLSAADQAYRDALAAGTVPDAITALQRCLSADPAYRRAREALVPLLLLDGDVDAALVHASALESVHPRDPLPQLLRIGCLNAAGRIGAADEALAAARSSAGAVHAALFDSLKELFDSLDALRSSTSVDGAGDDAGATAPRIWFSDEPGRALRPALHALSKFVETTIEATKQSYSRSGTGPVLRRIHPLVPEALARLTHGFEVADARPDFEAAATQWPTSFSLFALAAADVDHADWAGADRHIRRARELRFLVNLEPVVGWFHLRCAGQSWHGDQTPATADRIRPQVREQIPWFLTWGKLTSKDFHVCFHLAKNIGETALALKVAEHWCERFPDEPDAWLWYSNQCLGQWQLLRAFVLGEKALAMPKPNAAAAQNMHLIQKNMADFGMDPEGEGLRTRMDDIRRAYGLVK